LGRRKQTVVILALVMERPALGKLALAALER
jgi:hypothetical protein